MPTQRGWRAEEPIEAEGDEDSGAQPLEERLREHHLHHAHDEHHHADRRRMPYGGG
jgi:hypothetical protein